MSIPSAMPQHNQKPRCLADTRRYFWGTQIPMKWIDFYVRWIEWTLELKLSGLETWVQSVAPPHPHHMWCQLFIKLISVCKYVNLTTNNNLWKIFISKAFAKILNIKINLRRTYLSVFCVFYFVNKKPENTIAITP